jgi:thiamine biosynthesis lipoprotein
MTTITLALHAMATRFELVLHGDNPVRLRAAGEEALGEIERLEAQLSLYVATSEIAHLNALAARAPVRVTPSLFRLLQHAQRLHAETGGAFDITIAPLVRCWGFMGGTGHWPDPAALAAARACLGMDRVELDPGQLTVRFAREGVMLDLGAIGKGYAIERAADLLREAGVTSALLHGGTSTVYALGHPPEAEHWTVAVEAPRGRVPGLLGGDPGGAGIPAGVEVPAALTRTDAGAPGQAQRREAPPAALLATVPLCDQALSVSAVWGRSFEAQGRAFGHVLDPRTGQPAAGALLAAVVLPSATETDSLSTALLVLSTAGHESIARLRPGIKTLLVATGQDRLRVEARGIEVNAELRC